MLVLSVTINSFIVAVVMFLIIMVTSLIGVIPVSHCLHYWS